MISIIIPTYNREKFITRALDSVVRAFDNLDEIEILVIDDASTDRTSEVVDKWISQPDTDRPILRYSKQSENQGPGVCRNIGMDLAAGDYVMFLDSDDELNNKLNIYNFKADITYGDVYIQFDEGNHRNRIQIFQNDINQWVELDATCCAKIYNLDFLRRNHLRFPESRFAEDLSFILKVKTCEPSLESIESGLMLISHAWSGNSMFSFSNPTNLHNTLMEFFKSQSDTYRYYADRGSNPESVHIGFGKNMQYLCRRVDQARSN